MHRLPIITQLELAGGLCDTLMSATLSLLIGVLQHIAVYTQKQNQRVAMCSNIQRIDTSNCIKKVPVISTGLISMYSSLSKQK